MFTTEGGFQIVKRGRNSPEPEQGIDTPAKYHCTDDGEHSTQPQNTTNTCRTGASLAEWCLNLINQTVGNTANISSVQHNLHIHQEQEHNIQTQQQQPLIQNSTPHPTHLDPEGNKKDPWPNKWSHKLPTDTINTVHLFTKNFNSVSPPPDKISKVKLHNAIIDLHALDAGILTGQELCIEFKQKGQTQELKYDYMKKLSPQELQRYAVINLQQQTNTYQAES